MCGVQDYKHCQENGLSNVMQYVQSSSSMGRHCNIFLSLFDSQVLRLSFMLFSKLHLSLGELKVLVYNLWAASSVDLILFCFQIDLLVIVLLWVCFEIYPCTKQLVYLMLMVDNLVETTKDLIRFLRRDNDSCDTRRQLGDAEIVSKDLIPILKQYSDDRILFDTVIR